MAGRAKEVLTGRAKVELLAPARDLEAGRAAVDCGADAVYIGGPAFGARHAAGNSVDDIAALVRYARPFGVRVYATLNTLVFDNEITEAETVGLALIEAGVDALIVQDMAWLRMPAVVEAARAAGVEFHASTQTANVRPEDVVFLGRAGFRRVILERALSIDEIRAIRQALDTADGLGSGSGLSGVELEVFVHGAVCVGYSGRCFMSRVSGTGRSDGPGGVSGNSGSDRSSNLSGERSGNRGACSQPCRLAYDLVDGDGRVLIEGKHLLSVCDMDLSARLGELLDAGVASFKIEGRLKDTAYVRNVVSHYRRLVDEAIAARNAAPGVRFVRASEGVSHPDFEPDPAKSFTRGPGAGEYFFNGPARGMASFDTPKSVGEFVGRVERIGCDRTGGRWFVLDIHHKHPAAALRLSAGDGICFFAGPELRGTNINRVEAGRGGALERVYPNRMDGIGVGTEIYRNYDHAFVRALEHSRTRRRIGVRARVEIDPERFEAARDPVKMAALVREEFSKSGDTIFEVTGVEIVGQVRFVPVSVLAGWRREWLQGLLKERMERAPERRPGVEDVSARFPRTRVGAEENVVNRLAERFYRDHGVVDFEPALELRTSLDGEVVMRTRYCIRREIGECFGGAGAGFGAGFGGGLGAAKELFLQRGGVRYLLGFDCAKCEMTVVKMGPAGGRRETYKT